MLKCKLFRCECGEVKDVIKGYDVVCNLECEECQECEDLKGDKEDGICK